MIYHHIALNVPLGLLTYSYPQAIPAGTRVAVPFRGREAVGVVWETDVKPEIAPAKILPVKQVFGQEPPLPEDWRALLDFVSRYYLYPIGQAVFAALPQGMREARAVTLPQPPHFYGLSEEGRMQAPPPVRFSKQHALWQALAAGHQEEACLKAIHPQAGKLLQQWRQAGWLDESEAAAPQIAASQHLLNDGQQAAADTLQTGLSSFQTFLLYGITGSGKTEVYFDAMAKVLAQGRQVLFLLPEINLTPQLLKRVNERFGQVPTAVLHSQTAAGRRTQDYLRAMTGQAKLVIGTRLAVFTPLPDLALIVVDEEHDASFKQDNELRYHARDLAVWRGKQSACPVVLGSATPSLESWHKAQSGGYRLLELTQRARRAARPPQVEILDVRRQQLDNGFSQQALKLIQENHQNGGLTLVYLNRRGFAPALFCGDCGHIFGCPRCSAKMVLHQRVRQLRCHHCDFRQAIPRKCPDCGNQDLTAVGHGTQRVEETLKSFLPQATVVRVDRDSTARKNDWERLYRDIADNRIDVLVGTQMLAKGHDFARLNLVVVLNADGSLYSADFRAPEKLFAELMQVAGRAGRADAAGRVLIQTQLPEHPVFAAVQAQDYPAFAAHELAERKMFGMPPFGFQAAVRADAVAIGQAQDFLAGIKAEVENRLPPEVSLLGPVPMFMMRLAERERAQVFLESPSRKQLHRAAALWLYLLQGRRDAAVRWSIDVDPLEM
ncbi:MAG: primosomal protein N' [Neisseria sp.]|uniref:primosomal protein N' n=1 Tax=Neisseria sp. TaxID=192066 RepID=UPI0026DC9A00|nr:primosomal protein N' [Neisseria sp.]MDO4247918.1 primosomal protein N' [Neisseria sp.]